MHTVFFFVTTMHEDICMSEKEDDEIKDGELNVDALDAAFDDHGFGEEDAPVIESHGDSEEDEGGAEWRVDDDNTDW